MIELLAPNGEPSNLTPEQYKLVRQKAFKDWFGDWENDPANASKVVDENGEPLVVYHGSKSFDIHEFDRTKTKIYSNGLKEFGTYFTDNKTLANAYKNWGELTEEEELEIDNQILKWKKILDDSRNNRDYDNAEYQINLLKESKKGKIYRVFLNLKKVHIFDAKGDTNVEAWNNLVVDAGYKWAINRDAMEFLKEGKFGVEKVDGIEATNIVDAFVQTEELNKELLSNVYLVFDSENIKLADGSNTTFDGNNPDIRYADGGSVLLAPNGKPSNLTPEQYKLVRTPEFKAWFGDWENDPTNASKVVDENGEPLICYHGSRGVDEKTKFNCFNLGNGAYGEGIYFTANKKEALGWALGNYVYEVFLDIKNPFRETYYHKWNQNITESKNYSGIIVMDLQDVATIIAFNPTQIKLADGNNTTFDSNNPDIRFDEGGITISDEFSNESYDFGNVGNSIKKNNREVGQIQYDINKEKSIVRIYLLEVLEKGIGAKVINYFFNNGINTIYGDAVDSIEFWNKMGAKYDEFDEDINGYPFTISKEDFVQTKYYEDEKNPDIRFDDGGETNKNENNMIIKFTPKIIDYLADQVDIMMETYDNDYDDNGILDEGIEEEYPFTLAKNRNDLENLQLKIQNAKGSSYSQIEKDFLIERIEMTLDAMYDDSEMVSQIRALKYAQNKLQENNTDYADGGFVMDEEKGEKFIKKLSELGCNKPLTNFQMNFFGFLDSLKDDCVSLGGFWYDSNTTNYAYSQMGKMVLFDIEDFYNEKERSAFIEKNYPTSTPLEIQPFDDNNYEFIGIGEASMGGVFRDIRDGSILKLTASPFEVVGTTKILNAQKKDIHYEDNFAEIYSIQNIGKGVFKGTWYYKYYNEREFNGNWFAIRREDITPFNEQEQKEANCVKEIIVNYYSMFDNRNYQPEIFGSYDIYEPNREFQYLLRKQNNYGEGGDINWNLDRYRQVEKEMYDLRTQGKGDTLEYFKLIKERSILEQAKMNPSYDSKNSFAKGGNIIAYKKDFQKFNKIGITDKYIIEAITEIGLQDTKFDKESIEKTIENEFKNLLKSYQEYIISEDSNEISRQILFDKNARFLAGEEDENLKDFDNLINSKERRKEEYIEKYADTQIETINEWISYLTKSEYPVAIKFLLLKSVLNFNYNYKIDDLIKRTDTTIRNFTLFDAGSLSELIASNSDYLLKDYTKIQLENAEKIIKSKEFVKTSGDGTWLKFNGGSNTTEEEISKNSIELSQLVQNTYWCTKTNSKSQLDGGDFYVYVTKNNGEIFPRIAIRMEEDLVGEVRGNKSSAQDIEEEMLPIAEEFLQKSISNDSGKKWLDSINYNKEALNFSTKLTEDGIFENSVEEFIKLKSKEKQNLLDYADRNGHIVRIEDLLYKLINSPNKFYAKNEVVIKLSDFDNKKTKIILGNADFRDSQITDLGQLNTIGGDADFYDSQITDLRNLTYIGGNAYFTDSKITDLGNLTTIGGSASFNDSQVTDLGNLTTIGGDASFNSSEIKDLGNLTKIGGNADFQLSKVINLGNLTTIEGNAYFKNSKITDLKNLKTIKGTPYFGDSKLTNLGNLTTIGGTADFGDSKLTNLGNLTTIVGTANFKNSKITDLKNLTTIGGNAYFGHSQVTDLGNLTTIGGIAEFFNSKLKDLGNLTTINGDAYFENSQVINLGNLQTIGNTAYFGYRIDLKKEWEKIKNTNKNKTKNMNIQTTENFAKGGKILIKEITENGNIKIVHQDFQKFLRIGITDKYFIEASNDVGLQGVNFDEASLLKKISIEFNNMLDEYEDYIINEDSEFITNIMKNKIKTEKRRGASLEVLRELELEIDNDNARKREIREIAGTQKESLQQWILYLKQSDYNVIFKYLILKAVLKFNYTLNTDKLSERDNITIRNFTPFDAGSLAELYYGSSNYLLKDYVLLMNENSKKVFKTQEVIKTTSEGKWIKFNGGNKTTSKERDENGVQLMRLVQNTYWCTKSAGRSQLDGGDFYVYVTEKDGEILPRIAVRMNENLVGEIRGNFSSAQDIEPEMLPISESFLVENIPNDSGKKWLDAIRYNTKCAEMTERFNTEGMYQDFIFDYIKLIAEKSKYKVDYGENGNVVNLENKFKEVIKISNEFYKSGDIEIDSDLITKKTIYLIGDLTKYELDKLINKQVKINELKNWKLKFISGNLECSDIITDLGNIEIIGKSLRLSPKFENLNKLKFIGTELEFNGSNVESLKNLESIGSGLMLNGKIKDLGKLKKIGFLNINTIDDSFSLGNLEEIVGDLNIFNDTIDFDFGDLKTIGGSLNASNSKITDLKNLESVGNDFIINGSKIKNFQNLKTIGGDADFSNNFSSSTQNIESILGSIKLLNSRIMDFPKLLKIGGELYFKGSFFKSLGSIKYIGGNLNFAESKVEDLGDLESIGGYASFKSSSSNIKSLKKLKNIVKFANFTDSMVEDLGDLESIGGNVYFKDSKVKSLGKLNFVGGLVMMKKNNYNGLEGFRDIISQELKN